ncbi:predicted protein [Naegleria gruberi]|uniref:Predicted protein n=1 Tax=Naegleria gruberi TaxID=5762 RepID=D2W1U5_NAEGR|nr:uncharacterized protein NAEGRDRAFT_54059 [Naegleria gruberi]EFC36978.1 predicted protein [Naegleria gruberi]|eukprot:XP_002669722.1 predicted protein [Naegleria gruberi strain NEG-M]
MEQVYGKFSGAHYKPKPLKSATQTRYLWTDAFAVCNFLSLHVESGQDSYLEQAKALIEEVHQVLGKDRSLQHYLDFYHFVFLPTSIHAYLTKWMFALNRTSLITRDVKYNEWAIEMAQSMHNKFINHSSSRGLRMFWKISIDGSRPVVRSEGNLDPYDGYVTYRLLQLVNQQLKEGKNVDGSVLNREIEEMKGMVMGKYLMYQSSDPLDLGETLWLTSWFPDEDWANHMRKVAISNIEEIFESTIKSTRRRLGFRDFGVSIGLQTIPENEQDGETRRIVENIHSLWKDHLFERDHDITPVMYCSSLLPGVFNPNFLY